MNHEKSTSPEEEIQTNTLVAMKNILTGSGSDTYKQDLLFDVFVGYLDQVEDTVSFRENFQNLCEELEISKMLMTTLVLGFAMLADTPKSRTS